MGRGSTPGPARARRRLVVTGVLVAAVVAATVAILTWRDSGPEAPVTFREYAAGQRPAAPRIAGELLAGSAGHFDLADARGDVVVVNVWASWCGPCRAETADLEQVNQSVAELGVRFVGVNIRDERDKAISFMEGRVTYPSIFDPAFETGLGFEDPPAPLGPPATLVIDRDGGLAVAFYRLVDRTELERAVRRIAAEPVPAGTAAPAAPAAPGTTAAPAGATATIRLGWLGSDRAPGNIRHFLAADRRAANQVGYPANQVKAGARETGRG